MSVFHFVCSFDFQKDPISTFVISTFVSGSISATLYSEFVLWFVVVSEFSFEGELAGALVEFFVYQFEVSWETGLSFHEIESFSESGDFGLG